MAIEENSFTVPERATSLQSLKRYKDEVDEALTFRYDLPTERLKADSDSDSEFCFYMCSNTALNATTFNVDFFLKCARNLGMAENEIVNKIQESNIKLLKIARERNTEMKTPEDMKNIKELIEDISKNMQIVYDQANSSNVSSASAA